MEGKPAEEVKPAEQSQRIGCIHWNKSHLHLLGSSHCPSIVKTLSRPNDKIPW